MYLISEVLKWKRDKDGWSVRPDIETVKIKIGNGAEIGDEAKIGDGAEIGDEAEIGNEAKIGDVAKIGERGKIGKGAKIEKTPLQIQGTRHLVIYTENLVQIGCFRMPIKDWKIKGEKLAKDSYYTDEEIKEYKQYLKWIGSLELAGQKKEEK